MGEVTRVGARMTIGLDLGDRYSQLCVLDEHGEVCEEGRIATTCTAPGSLDTRLTCCSTVRNRGARLGGGWRAWPRETTA